MAQWQRVAFASSTLVGGIPVPILRCLLEQWEESFLDILSARESGKVRCVGSALMPLAKARRLCGWVVDDSLGCSAVRATRIVVELFYSSRV